MVVALVFMFIVLFNLLVVNSDTIFQRLNQDRQLSTFKNHFKWYEGQTNISTSRLTIFVPTNDAFEEFDGTVDLNVILYHVSYEVLDLVSLRKRSYLKTARNHDRLWVNVKNDTIFVNNARILEEESDYAAVTWTGQYQVLHVIDRVLAPLPSNISSRGRKGMDFIASEHAYSYDFEVFHSKLVLYKHLRPIFNFEGPNTYFLPIDVYITSRHLRKLDDLVVRGHIVVGNALFTRATPEGVVYKTACDGSYVQIRVRLVNKEGSMFVASDSYSVNHAHDTGVVLAKILVRDIPLQNGVLHIIDRPLGVLDSPATFFPYLSMYYKISGDPTLNISYHLIKKAGWEELLKINDTQLTFFVPQDSAYSRLKPRYMELLFENAQEAIGRHLVLSANPYSVGALIIDSEASPLHLKAFSGTLNIGVTKIDEDYWIKWKLWTMKITRPDYECTNGVVHIMNGLFLDGTDLFRFGSRS